MEPKKRSGFLRMLARFLARKAVAMTPGADAGGNYGVGVRAFDARDRQKWASAPGRRRKLKGWQRELRRRGR